MEKFYFLNNRCKQQMDYHSLFRFCIAGFISLFILSPFFFNVQAQTDLLSDIKFSGDSRFRYENTSNDQPNSIVFEGRNRAVVRFRGGFTKKFSDLFHFGLRVTTGSSDDPNTADVTLGSFVNDLEISLDRLYLNMSNNNFSLSGGKFANPFKATDLVWDGDVNPQGVTASYTYKGSKKIIPKISGIFFTIDEHPETDIPDSDMLGGQIQVSTFPSEDLRFSLSGSYYDYDITALNKGAADAGDTRSNYLIFDSTGTAIAYLSDFDLVNVIGVLEYRGFGERFPVVIIGDYVKNIGAAVDEDQGFAVDLFVGRTSKKNDMRFRYGYSQTETDAILTAFSNDNTTIPSNYKQHTITFDYFLLDKMVLNLTWYIYKLNLVTIQETNEFISRLRLNVSVKF
jgi:Putative porin